ncbi:MAG: polyphosphate kinase 1 [Turicibacter sp.]
MTIDLSAYENYLNRELSWLQFNRRVLEEVEDEQNPLLERVRFLSIFSSNLDEFFMVRIGSLYSIDEVSYVKTDISGLRPSEQINFSLDCAGELYKKAYVCYDKLQELLQPIGIQINEYRQLPQSIQVGLEDYYKQHIFPILSPMIITPATPFPLVSNKTLNIAIMLMEKKNSDKHHEPIFATLQVPTFLSRLVELPKRKEKKFILLENLIKEKLSDIFTSHHILACSCYRVTRNANSLLDEEGTEDLFGTIQKYLDKRRFGECVRLEIERGMNSFLLETLMDKLEINHTNVYQIKGPIDLSFLHNLADLTSFDNYRYEVNVNQPIQELEHEDIFEVLKKKDIFLHHPYHSFSHVMNFIESAVADPNVLAIKQTLYRVSVNSPLVHALSRAAKTGKQVTVLVELKARFDEENNIQWARQLEQAGCHVIYGVVGLKTHSKISLVVRKEESDIRHYVHIGTGNYNEVTAHTYTDMGLMTSNQEYGEDTSALFDMLSGRLKLKEMNKLTTAPLDLRKKLIKLIQREAEFANQGKPAQIIAKMNSITDREIIIELYKASIAGVQIELVVRGVCVLKPGIKNISDNITVRSVVGRYLEHSRVCYFYANGNEHIYLSSADWMDRNLSKRIETMCIVEDRMIKQTIKEILKAYLSDTAKTRILMSDGSYRRVTSQSYLNVQEELFTVSMKNDKKMPVFSTGIYNNNFSRGQQALEI